MICAPGDLDHAARQSNQAKRNLKPHPLAGRLIPGQVQAIIIPVGPMIALKVDI
jgi:hypothetical protein